MKRNVRNTSIVLGLGAFVLYFLYRLQYVDGDSLIYLDNILRGRYGDLTVHVGYYITGYPLVEFFSLLGVTPDHALIMFSVLSGAVGVSLCFLFWEKLLGDVRAAAMAATVLGLAGGYFAYSLEAEVYVPQTMFVLLAMYTYVRGYVLVAGLAYALGMLISPLSLFAGPFFLIWALLRQVTWRQFALFVVVSLLIYLPAFAWMYDDLMFGRRGLIPAGVSTSVAPVTQALKQLVVVSVKSFHVFVLFALIGFIRLYRRYRRLAILVIIMTAAQYYILVKAHQVTALETFLLVVFCYPVGLIGLGLRVTVDAVFHNSKARSIAAVVAIALFGLASVGMLKGVDGILSPTLGFDHRFARRMQDLADKVEPGDAVISSFRKGLAYAYYTRQDPLEEIEITMGNHRWYDSDYLTPDKLEALVQSAGNIFVVESYSPSPGASMLLSEERLREKKAAFSLGSRYTRLLGGLEPTTFTDVDDVTIYQFHLSSQINDEPQESLSGSP